jgi:hypothetical protein
VLRKANIQSEADAERLAKLPMAEKKRLVEELDQVRTRPKRPE